LRITVRKKQASGGPLAAKLESPPEEMGQGAVYSDLFLPAPCSRNYYTVIGGSCQLEEQKGVFQFWGECHCEAAVFHRSNPQVAVWRLLRRLP
jgi:hypothetical protein